jgi:hypothetical protein
MGPAPQGPSRDEVCRAFDSLLQASPADDGAASRIAAAMGFSDRALAQGAGDVGAQAARCEAVEALAQRIAQGQDVRLLCWCFPKACHADLIASCVRRRAGELSARVRRKRVR